MKRWTRNLTCARALAYKRMLAYISMLTRICFCQKNRNLVQVMANFRVAEQQLTLGQANLDNLLKTKEVIHALYIDLGIQIII